MIPLFTVPKKKDSLTVRVTKWRLIRGGTHSGKGEISINDATSDKYAKTKMPSTFDIKNKN